MRGPSTLRGVCLLLLLVPPVTASAAASDDELGAALCKRLNEFRRAMGMVEVEYDPKLSPACKAHADYLEANPDLEEGSSHTEDPKRPNYSEAGKKCAERALIAFVKDPATAMDSFLATFYHRIPLLDPQLPRIGLGVASKRDEKVWVVIDVGTRNYRTRSKNYPILFPYPDQHNVPRHFSLGGVEWPDPRPDRSAKPGYPITISGDALGWLPGEASVVLQKDGKEVPCWLFTPERPAVKTHPHQESVCLLPKQALLPSSKYTVIAKCKMIGIEKTPEWTRTWSFTTEAAPPQNDNEK